MSFPVRSLFSLAGSVARAVGRASGPAPTIPQGLRDRLRAAGTSTTGTAPSPTSPRTRAAGGRATHAGRVLFEYSPSPDGRPDPGEVVWAWVPYEDDPRQGKDRPVLIVGREGTELLGLMLTSRDRNNARERDDRYVDIGTGPWDSRGRPSEVKVDRLLRIEADAVRREGAVLSRRRFADVVARVPGHLLD